MIQDPPIAQRIYEAYSAFCLKAEDMAQEIGRSAELAERKEDPVPLLQSLTASKKNAEILAKELLMAAYFTANYRNCLYKSDIPQTADVAVLDGSSQAARLMREETERVELQKQKEVMGKNGGGSAFGAALASPLPPPSQASKRKRGLPGTESLEEFHAYTISRYKSLHGLNERQAIGIPMMSISSSAALAGGRVLHRTELLAEINTFLRKFGLNPIDKRDDIWRKWFLEDFLGLNAVDSNNNRALMVLDTPQRRADVYKHTLQNVCELAKKVLDG
jgi:hypothetical protein